MKKRIYPALRYEHDRSANQTHERLNKMDVPKKTERKTFWMVQQAEGEKRSCYSLTVPAVDLEERNVLCFIRDNPKSHT